MPTVQVNNWGILAATAFAVALGALWYSELLFGKTWMKLVGKKQADLMKSAGQTYALTAVLWLMASYVLALFVQWAAAITAVQGAMVGFYIWTGFVFTTGLIHTMYSGRSKRLFAIDAGYTLVALMGMGMILVILPN